MEEVRKLIGSAKLEDALVLLLSLVSDVDKELVISLQDQMNSLRRSELMGIISFSEKNLERNKITAAALQLTQVKPIVATYEFN